MLYLIYRLLFPPSPTERAAEHDIIMQGIAVIGICFLAVAACALAAILFGML